MRDIRKFNYIEFYHEQYNLQQSIRAIKDNLKSFNVYMPKFQMKVEDMQLAMNQIKVDIRERLNGYFTETDHDFALQNYEYVTKTLNNKEIIKIYKQLGPFDFFQEGAPKIDPLDDAAAAQGGESRSLQERFDKRRSGAVYRGEVNTQTNKPEGRGIKIFPNGSVFEGYFTEGHVHGIGRGVTSRGEVYQGQFSFDQMEGQGYFQWPDGSMYDGEWRSGKKNGKGKFFWTNGQIYEGEFKDNECNGNGLVYYPCGKIFEG